LKYSLLNLLEKVKFNSGGRVVAGSNPVTPTNRKALIIQQLSVLFFFIRTCRK
jgi:histidinol dehydrogenase